MDYEKKYKEARERAKQVKHDVITIGCKMDPDMLDIIFPELAESEDERIRKWIANYIHRGVFDEEEHPKALKAVEWLEKQKEQEQPDVKDPFDDEQFRRGYEAGKHDAMREQKKREKRK